ncbi:ketoacyl-ACP synthase III [Streptomyces sp. NPDC002589]|uniref:3-oxoacyl-ACP synthase III family protein n=1 Tax=Streptomyces sp. NPDC002589 TaxID=3154420 RepID=UPI0033288A58
MSLHRAPVAILGTGSCVPDRVMSNDEVGAPAGVDDAWIVRKTGIRERRWAAPGEATSDLATGAARRALKAAGIGADQLSAVVVGTSTPDHQQPATAAFVHQNLGGSRTAVSVFDVNAVCAGFMSALEAAHALVALSGGYALAIGADTYSRILNPADRRSVILFGDGAGAVLVGPAGAGRGIRASAFHIHSALTGLIRVPAGGSRRPYDPAAHDAGLQYFTMDGRAVREFFMSTVPHLTKQFLNDSEVLPSDIAHVIPHQANGLMLDELGPMLDLPGATVHRTVRELGNTGAASVPLTLDRAARSGALRRGELVLLLGMGGGMSISFTLVQW